jgi:ribonucleotide reductase alpha subunit
MVEDGSFNFTKLKDITMVVTRNLNKIIDKNYYPVKEAQYSNQKHRPIGIGVQGLADCFIRLRYPFDSPEASILNKQIFETIYYAALVASNELAREEGPYTTFNDSPASTGILQYDMWGVVPSDRWNWQELKTSISEHGLRNSLLVAPMPTASTAQIMGNNECIEPYTSNIYTRRVLSGDFPVINKHLYLDLIRLGIWSTALKNEIIAANGSVQTIARIPHDIKNLYKTAWEIRGKVLVDMSADRGAFICQSQSFNAFMTEVNYPKLTSFHFYGWKRGLKTGMYYLRTKAAADAIQFTVEKGDVGGDENGEDENGGQVCTRTDDCASCSA